MLLRHKKEPVVVFRPELVDIFISSSFCPVRSTEDGQRICIYRIERHSFKTTTFPFESRVAFRVICDPHSRKVDPEQQESGDCLNQSGSSLSSSADSGAGTERNNSSLDGASNDVVGGSSAETVDLTCMETTAGALSEEGSLFSMEKIFSFSV